MFAGRINLRRCITDRLIHSTLNIEAAVQLTDKEKHAIVEAADAFEQHGIYYHLPWEGDLDDLERDKFTALVEACRAYHSTLSG